MEEIGNDTGDIQCPPFQEADGRPKWVCWGPLCSGILGLSLGVNSGHRRVGTWCSASRCLSLEYGYQEAQRRDAEEADSYPCPACGYAVDPSHDPCMYSWVILQIHPVVFIQVPH